MYIYKVTNNINGKVYIGRTKNIDARWKNHCMTAKSGKYCYKLHKAIRKFGPENFTVEQIDCSATKEEADAKEVYWIEKYNSMESGYNSSPGGKAGGHRKKVMSVEDGLVFDTMVEAAKHYGRSHGAIWQVVDKPHLTAAGKHWISV